MVKEEEEERYLNKPSGRSQRRQTFTDRGGTDLLTVFEVYSLGDSVRTHPRVDNLVHFNLWEGVPSQRGM
jgi:hypothetical protein